MDLAHLHLQGTIPRTRRLGKCWSSRAILKVSEIPSSAREGLVGRKMKSESLSGIAIVGVGCYYPGAKSPKEFWENILARRREFRNFPDCRLPLSDYHS